MLFVHVSGVLRLQTVSKYRSLTLQSFGLSICWSLGREECGSSLSLSDLLETFCTVLLLFVHLSQVRLSPFRNPVAPSYTCRIVPGG